MAFNQTKFFDELEQLTIKTDKDKKYDNFIYDLLHLLDKPKSTITQLKKGSTRINVANDPEAGEVALKMGIYYIPKPDIESDELPKVLDEIKSSAIIESAKIRMIVVTNFKEVLLYDTKMDDTIDVPFLELHKDYSFMLPLAGLERATEYTEHPADVKASEKMGRLFDYLKKINDVSDDNEMQTYSLNTFFVRTLFCLFAEDTGIFSKSQFHNALQSTTKKDGSDTKYFLQDLFEILDSEPDSDLRKKSPKHLADFPYVNGNLFKEGLVVPSFDSRSRRLLLNCSEMNWADINPDIFGSMFQAVVDVEQRGTLGQHYTSVSNIMKVISPLFLGDIKEELEKIKSLSNNNASRDRKWERLDELHDRISDIKLFDPSCGSGNFLIIAYKELRKVEIEILGLKQERLQGSSSSTPTLAGLESTIYSSISLDNLYGIEYDEFPSQIAKLALWLAEHQMNLAFREKFGFVPATLPLKDSGNIVHGNALRLDWNEVCPNNSVDEIYVIGNPPFGGTGGRSEEQTKDMEVIFEGFKSFKALDYVSCWFWKSAQYIANTKTKMALVSTNSISQGTQVATIFPPIFDLGIEIEFAYQSFPWRNNAKNKAAVHVVIVGLADKKNIDKKIIFSLVDVGWRSEVVNNINPYLVKGTNLAVKKRAKALHSGSTMIYGNKPTDGGFLFLTHDEKTKLITEHPSSRQWVKKVLGSEEFLNSKERWCLWFRDTSLSEITNIDCVKDRLDGVKKMRFSSKSKVTRQDAKKPHLFQQISQPKSGNYILVPRVSSERRTYIPMGFFDADVICTDRNQMIPDGTLFDFGILNSLAHNDWMRLVTGRLESRYNYSNTIVYNTFVFPEVNEEQKQHISDLAFKILLAREEHPDKTLAQMYDPDTMPKNLLEAHRELDKAVDELYKAGGFRNASERVEHLLKLYEKAVAEEENSK